MEYNTKNCKLVRSGYIQNGHFIQTYPETDQKELDRVKRGFDKVVKLYRPDYTDMLI